MEMANTGKLSRRGRQKRRHEEKASRALQRLLAFGGIVMIVMILASLLQPEDMPVPTSSQPKRELVEDDERDPFEDVLLRPHVGPVSYAWCVDEDSSRWPRVHHLSYVGELRDGGVCVERIRSRYPRISRYMARRDGLFGIWRARA